MFAGIFAAGVGLIVLIVASIRLSIEDNSQFVVFWSALYLVFAVVSGLSVEITRNVSMAGSVSNESGKPARHHISGITWIATGLVVALGFALMPVWRLALPTLTGLTNWIVCGALVFGVAGYIAQAGLIGALAGKQQWSLYSYQLSTYIICKK